MKISFLRNIGFTLMELLIVISIISILAALAVARWPGHNISLNAQTQQLANDIRYTQSLAMSRGQRYRINFSANSYNITDTSGTIINNPTTNATTTSLTSGITISLPPTNLPNNLVAFDATGAPYTNSSATTSLSSNATITVTKGSINHTITILPQTGKVTVQ